MWLCSCSCGNTTVVRGSQLRNGSINSCGCYWQEQNRKPRTEKTPKTVCDTCGKHFYEKSSSVLKTDKHFCCRNCYSEYQKQLTFDKANSYKGVRKPGDPKWIYSKIYRKAHPERIAHLKAQRYARERGAEGSYTIEEWEALCEKHQHRCAICGEQKPLTVDHIIPLSKGGTNYISNIQPLCRNCNSKKHNKLDYSSTS